MRLKDVFLGIVDGRSVWASGQDATQMLKELKGLGISNICVQSSVSLQHLPYTIVPETQLPEGLANRLAFAVEKVDEIVQVGPMGT